MKSKDRNVGEEFGLRFGRSTLEAVYIPSEVVLFALSTLPVAWLDFNPWVCKPIPALLHEEARPG